MFVQCDKGRVKWQQDKNMWLFISVAVAKRVVDRYFCVTRLSVNVESQNLTQFTRMPLIYRYFFTYFNSWINKSRWVLFVSRNISFLFYATFFRSMTILPLKTRNRFLWSFYTNSIHKNNLRAATIKVIAFLCLFFVNNWCDFYKHFNLRSVCG